MLTVIQHISNGSTELPRHFWSYIPILALKFCAVICHHWFTLVNTLIMCGRKQVCIHYYQSIHYKMCLYILLLTSVKVSSSNAKNDFNYLGAQAQRSNPCRRYQCLDHTWCQDQYAPGCQSQSCQWNWSFLSSIHTHAPKTTERLKRRLSNLSYIRIDNKTSTNYNTAKQMHITFVSSISKQYFHLTNTLLQ